MNFFSTPNWAIRDVGTPNEKKQSSDPEKYTPESVFLRKPDIQLRRLGLLCTESSGLDAVQERHMGHPIANERAGL